MKLPRGKPASGQVLPIALAVLLILTIFVPLMVFFSQRDAIWSVKQAANTRAFHLAESGVEKAYLYISQSTTTWQALMNGTAQAGYNFDATYSDVGSGTYAVSITSGPGAQQATVIAVGRDALKRESRALKVVYGNSVFGNLAIYAGTGLQIAGGVQVEWGGVMSPNTIDYSQAAKPNHPQLWSASAILGKDADPNPPNCDSPDCVQWHAYYPNIPPAPAIDFDQYRALAKANTAASSNCGTNGGNASVSSPTTSCYYPGTVNNWKEKTTSGTMFVEGDLNVIANGMYHTGTLIVMGNLNLPNGVWGGGPSNTVMTMPPDAWKQYGNDWSYYRTTFDAAAPANFPGLLGTSYTTPPNCSTAANCKSSKLAVNGMMYVGGSVTNSGGGGSADVYGAMYVIGSASATANASGVTFYYNAAAANGLLTTNISLSRVSWQNMLYAWPSSAGP